MTRTTVGVSILVSSLAAAAFAQGPGLERVFPQSYLTQPHPESITTPDPKMASILYYQVHIAQPNATLDPSVPEEAAQMYMAKLRAELTAGRLTPDTINVWLHGWENAGR